MAKVQFRVIRRHEGPDRVYEEGDIREGTEAELGHLVPNVLERVVPKGEEQTDTKPAAKAEPAASNKAEAAPANKSEPTGKRTTR